jgi:hypothetical protein
MNTYEYVSGNPLMLVDPTGEVDTAELPPVDIIYVGSKPWFNFLLHGVWDEVGFGGGAAALKPVTGTGLPGDCYGDQAAQYWADKAVQTENPLYNIPGAVAALWTPETSGTTASVLFWSYAIREAGATWLMRDGVSQGRTLINIPWLTRLERHPFGRGAARQDAWHSHLLEGKEHLPASAGAAVTGAAVAADAAAVAALNGGRCDRDH